MVDGKRCLDVIIGYIEVDEDGGIDRFAALAKKKRFEVLNASWIENVVPSTL